MINKKNTTLKSYKGFDKDLKCRDFQYEVGKEYETDRAIVCAEGFHACTDPLAVWDYYSPCDNSRFCEVEQGGEIEKEESTSKVSSTKIKIKAEIGIAGLVKAHIDILKESTINKIKEWVGKKDIDKNSAQIGSSGDSAKIGSSGDSAQIGSSGYSAQIGSSGDSAQIGSSGYSAKIGSSGDYAQIDSTGERAVIANIGYNGIVKAEEGSWVTLAEYGDSTQDEKGRWYRPCKCVKSFNVTSAQSGKWLALKNGEVVEVKNGND